MTTIKTRFAPSPTGHLHIGGARTALYSYLFAKQNNGKFILRIEDTDKERSDDRFSQDIINALLWLGITWDEGPYYQSKRIDIYNEYSNILLKQGLAYKKDEAVFFRIPETDRIEINDLIHGKITFNTKELNDFVIIKSDGYPAFHFAVVIDDAVMGITHIIRGDDHISNTPKQLLLYQALELTIPVYAHLPLIVGKDHTPLSKRHGDTALSEYQKHGYLPDSLVNFLARMGWGYQNQEIFSMDELISLFDVKKVSKSPAVFDTIKLNWINAQYLKKSSPDYIYQQIQEKVTMSEQEALPLINLFLPKAANINELVDGINYCTSYEYPFEEELMATYLSKEDTNLLLDETTKELKKIDGWNTETIETAIRTLAQNKGIKAAQIIHPLRAALTGRKITPGIFELMEVLGKEKTITRLLNKSWLAKRS
ncbi:MAG: glutamate--tRNA ligase [Candidatus Margulisiibacteriota bacterium]|nr:MAG: hypothetical protein A2X43_07290 [Candidatus Margulisbacteria bacterium GWD2_39_127]OGI03773.1 MAG: hypothetical protein A2X42_13080 [Candidatus Margulisbacteria bacterium GWF2_38_17]OGI05829.1 MAG: hypothetical protein A2X41_02830 [Candidatus Margulisbacteria bacterium GWE2_39_32]PZM77424.1 MAG: glutamate--tRNA ligase [Candidatus Margulisiibacteriota bacterium]HAR64105.1 glutamate--tRNA ligase [Candidatus Margulisiibacteriota bacterium]